MSCLNSECSFEKRCLIEVLFASIMPLTLCCVCTYGDFWARATWIEAGPQVMKLAKLRSLMR